MIDAAAATSPSIEEQRLRVSTLLRQVDAEVKKGNLDEALNLTRQVYKYDKKNLYARAFEERILVIKSEMERAELQKRTHGKVKQQVETEVKRQVQEIIQERDKDEAKLTIVAKPEERVEPRTIEVRAEELLPVRKQEYTPSGKDGLQRVEDIEHQLMQKMNSMMESKQRQMEDDLQRQLHDMKSMTSNMPDMNLPHTTLLQQLQINNIPGLMRMQEQQEEEFQGRLLAERSRFQEELTRRMQEEQRRIQEQVTDELQLKHMEEMDAQAEKAHKRALDAYRSTLAILMQYKIPKLVQQVVTRNMRTSLEITETEHTTLERSAQVEAYSQELREMLHKGSLAPADLSALAKLQGIYNVSEEEHKGLAKRVKRELGLPDDSAIIFLIDDDPVILAFMEAVLKKTYPSIHKAENIEAVADLFKQTTPDLIICDVTLPGEGGFTFYENMQQGKYGNAVKATPFIFASALGDRYIINGAKQLGAKDYLVKPFTQETLERTVQSALA